MEMLQILNEKFHLSARDRELFKEIENFSTWEISVIPRSIFQCFQESEFLSGVQCVSYVMCKFLNFLRIKCSFFGGK